MQIEDSSLIPTACCLVLRLAAVGNRVAATPQIHAAAVVAAELRRGVTSARRRRCFAVI